MVLDLGRGRFRRALFLLSQPLFFRTSSRPRLARRALRGSVPCISFCAVGLLSISAGGTQLPSGCVLFLGLFRPCAPRFL